MTSWDMNKVIGAVLASVLFVLAIKMIVVPAVFYAPPPAKPGYIVQGVQETASTSSQQPAQEQLPDWGTVLPKADVAGGQQTAQVCAQCHDWSKGGPNKIGPNLWGVVGRPRASHPGFDYSSAMGSNHDPWTYDKLFVYLKSPSSMVPGTKMTFAGLSSTQQRINLIAFLRTQSDSPLPIPAPVPAKTAAAPAKPAAPNTSAGSKTPAAPAPVAPAPANKS
jgi:cytochrome c